MGTTVVVTVLAGDDTAAGDLASWAQSRIAELERRWSRFLPSSELGRLNAGTRGRPMLVSPDTFRLVETALAAWRLTTGAFDPTVHDTLVALGYDRTFTELERSDEPVLHRSGQRPAPGPSGIVTDPVLRAVTLPAGVSIDPGGIGKGLAADLVAEAVCAAGAQGALVDIGGDIRTCGHGPAEGAWIVEIDAPGGRTSRLALHDAGVATSSTRHRRWRTDHGTQHHLVDPRTGAPVDGPFSTATAIAPTAWLAEAATKAALVRGRTDIHPAAHVLLHGEHDHAVTRDLEELVR
jgi:thiamine biosynthesis lipoprotein